MAQEKNVTSCDQGLVQQWYICGNKMSTRCNRGFYCRS